MTTYAQTNQANYVTAQTSAGTPVGFPNFWQVADNTGMIYGFAPVNNALTIRWVALDMAAGTTPQPPAVGDPVNILAVIDNAGSPAGGDQIRLLATGVDTASASSLSVTIGGQQATILTVNNSDVPLPNERIVTVKTPAGSPGLADVRLSGPGGTSTVAKGFQYASSTTILPFSTSPNFLLYDPLRNRLYASHKDQVEVIDVAAKAVLTPLTPVGGKLASSQFAGLSLSPDSNRLYIADPGSGMIHTLNLANPGAGSSINISQALAGKTASATRVFELSTGKLMGSDSINLFVIDPNTGTGDWARDQYGIQLAGYLWGTTNQGRYAVLSLDGNGLVYSFIGRYDAESSDNAPPSAVTQWIVEANGNEDGTALIAGGSTPGIQEGSFEMIDSSLYPLGYLGANDDVSLPAGTPSFFMDATGALLYKAGIGGGSNGAVEIVDAHKAQPALTVILPEPIVTSYTPLSDHMMTTDLTGQTIFAVTQSGITIMSLNSIPLSIGNVQPAFVAPAGGQTLTVRGVGFSPGVTVMIDGSSLTTTYSDSKTLQVQTPPLASGWHDVTVTLANGTTYTAAALLHVLPNQPVPLVTGFSPASYTVQSGIPGFDTSATVTVLGQNFEISDTVQINGLPATTVFLDSAHLQVTIPATLTGTPGSISISVVSPYAASSNTMALPMLNPVPVLADNPVITFTPGSVLSLDLFGTGFVGSSIIQWNGQNLPTTLGGGLSDNGSLEDVYTYSPPSSLTATDGTATVTVFDPGPGGGTSNAITVEIGPPQPALTYQLQGGPSKLTTYYSTPTSIDFGNQVVGTSVTYNMNIGNLGTGPYILSGLATTPGVFTVVNGCSTLPVDTQCSVQFTFAPSALGPATASVTILDNLATSPETITLTGNAILTPQPTVDLTAIQSVGAYVTAQIVGSEVVGGPTIPGTMWVEYGTDQTLGSYTQSAAWAITGDGPVNQTLTGLLPGTLYAGRLALQTSGGTVRSQIHLFSTLVAPPYVSVSLATGTSATQTINRGQMATWQLTASDGGYGYSGTATFTCSGAPPTGASCVVNPTQATIGTKAIAFTVTVSTTAATTAEVRPQHLDGWWAALTFLFGGCLLTNRKRAKGLAFFTLLVVAISASVSCGGSSGSSTSGGGTSNATTPGTYALTITATAGTSQTSQYLTLVVQ